jgi:hypothetical protein
MKPTRTFTPLVILILAAIVATTSTSAAVVPKHGPSASGAGLFRFRDPSTALLELWSFSFEAVSNKNGRTRGRAQFDNLTAQTQVVVRINCLRISEGPFAPRAVISGTVLHSTDPDLPKMQDVLFAASDGPFHPFSTDTITPPFSLLPFDGQPVTCQDTEPLTVLAVEDGDIQISF